ncbi:hypothetical protein SAMN02745207_04286 [Clostridium grantii DSM 8605]|uniref:Uncharacterized protein n=2 Tax=Clostridium TaxID=1485 RepID=A0A1M5Y9I0_9CLOT|nr:hypothetical protein SAMN02745207_04286 [Clostridium grantii DSM 8605]
MEMTLNYSGAFCELGCDELEVVNGGKDAYNIICGAIFVGGITVAAGLIGGPLAAGAAGFIAAEIYYSTPCY